MLPAASVPCATLANVTINPHRDEIADYLRRASCHFGHTFREERDGLSVDEAAEKRDVGRDQVASCRRAVYRVLAGEFSANETQATYDEAVYRALLHFRGEMSDGLRQYVLGQLTRFKAEWLPDLKVEPLQCPYAVGSPAKAGAVKVREPHVCPDCHMAHAGDCW
ncbi:hypothetical protein AWC16_08425 [Mycolicibacter longobardus]|uniref:Uncharacterized protein n=1 Tax=Mycolicibacter longobardus TaxID=1108812 RepID=A0A1X1YMS5_9MYCO|nr:hypothetical protein AWC16_08425 [Mycolicibacter longobardus]